MKAIFFAFLTCLSVNLYSQLDDVNYYTTIAQEAYDMGEYQLSIDKCNVLLKKVPDNLNCKEIINKANTGLEEQKEAKRKIDIIEAQKAHLREQELGTLINGNSGYFLSSTSPLCNMPNSSAGEEEICLPEPNTPQCSKIKDLGKNAGITAEFSGNVVGINKFEITKLIKLFKDKEIYCISYPTIEAALVFKDYKTCSLYRGVTSQGCSSESSCRKTFKVFAKGNKKFADLYNLCRNKLTTIQEEAERSKLEVTREATRKEKERNKAMNSSQ